MPASLILPPDFRQDAITFTPIKRKHYLPKAIILGNDPGVLQQVWTTASLQKLDGILDLHHEVITTSELAKQRELLTDVEVILSTWSMPALTEDELD